MLKTLFIILLVCFTLNKTISQILYSERFNALSLTTGSYTSNSTLYTYLYSDVPNTMYAINNGNLIADTLTGNYPFRANGQKQKAWLSYVPVNGTDTFAVSTSWLNPTSNNASAWLITPTINNIAINTVLTWEAIAPDINNQDGYEVYISTVNTNTPTISQFTNLVYSITSENSSWQTHGISLSAFAGQNIRIAFKNNSNNKYQLWIDDIVVSNITNAFDASTIKQSVYKYSTINTNNTLSATFKNTGYTPISNLTINYKINNNVSISETKILSPALNYLDSKDLSFTIPYNSSIPQYSTFKIWPTLINGQSDQSAINDTVYGSITLSSSIPSKKIFLEEFTSVNCGWCPDANTTLASILNADSNVVVGSIHDNDNMQSVEGNNLILDYVNTLPSASIDQYTFPNHDVVAVDKTAWASLINNRKAMIVPATVTVTNVSYNNSTKQINATVSSTFVGDVKGDYRLNLYVKENNVFGPTNDFSDNQWNQHSSLFNIPSSSYYQLGSYLNTSENLLNTSEYKHQYVINKIIDGAYGATGIIPFNGQTNGQTYSKTYTYTLPNTTSGEFRYNADNIYLIGILSEYNANTKERAILNVAETKLTSNPEITVGINEITSINDFNLQIFPNPTSEICHLNYTLKNNEFVTINIYNTLGELVYIETKHINAGSVNHIIDVNKLTAGNYTIQVLFKANTMTKKLTIIK